MGGTHAERRATPRRRWRSRAATTRTSRSWTSSSARSRAPRSASSCCALSPRLNVLLISGAGRISPNAAKAAGASGFISKDWPAADIAGAVRMVGLGMTVFKPHESPAGPPLSEREREVLEAVASGATNREIAGRLYLSPHTVKEHTSSLYRKLGVRNRAEAVQKAQRLGLISLTRRGFAHPPSRG